MHRPRTAPTGSRPNTCPHAHAGLRHPSTPHLPSSDENAGHRAVRSAVDEARASGWQTTDPTTAVSQAWTRPRRRRSTGKLEASPPPRRRPNAHRSAHRPGAVRVGPRRAGCGRPRRHRNQFGASRRQGQPDTTATGRMVGAVAPLAGRVPGLFRAMYAVMGVYEATTSRRSAGEPSRSAKGHQVVRVWGPSAVSSPPVTRLSLGPRQVAAAAGVCFAFSTGLLTTRGLGLRQRSLDRGLGGGGCRNRVLLPGGAPGGCLGVARRRGARRRLRWRTSLRLPNQPVVVAA